MQAEGRNPGFMAGIRIALRQLRSIRATLAACRTREQHQKRQTHMLEWLQQLQPVENGMPTNPTMGVKLDPELRERLKALGNLRQRSVHWLMREAIREYVEREEALERHDRETLERWERYEATGEHVDNEAVMAWLDTWGTDEEEVECPVPRG